MTYKHFNNETTRSSVIRAVADTENEAAWQKLFDLYAGFVFSIARSKGLKEEDADDIVQVVFSDLARGSSLSVSEDASGNYTTTVSATEVADGVTITTSDSTRTATATNLAGSSTVTFQNNLDAVPYTGVDDSVDSWLTMVGLAGAAAGIAMALLAFVRRRSRSEGVQ